MAEVAGFVLGIPAAVDQMLHYAKEALDLADAAERSLNNAADATQEEQDTMKRIGAVRVALESVLKDVETSPHSVDSHTILFHSGTPIQRDLLVTMRELKHRLLQRRIVRDGLSTSEQLERPLAKEDTAALLERLEAQERHLKATHNYLLECAMKLDESVLKTGDDRLEGLRIVAENGIQIETSQDDLADGDDSSSFRDSAYGTWSATASVQGIISLPGVREEMLDILINDASLESCGQELLQDLDADKFVSMFKALLETFARELRDEAEGKEQRGAAHAFWRNAAYAANCVCEYWSGVESSKMTELLAQLPEKKIQLDHILQQISPLTSPGDIPDKNSDTGNDWEDQDLEDIQEPVHLKRLEDFITNSSAFGNLRAELRKLARSNTSMRATEFDYDVLFTKPLISAVQDLCKRAVEHAAGTKLSWWPLTEPEQELRPNYTRIYSQLHIEPSRANACFHDDIPTLLAEKLFPALTATRDIAQKWPWMPRWEANNSKAVLLRETTLMRVLYEASEQRRNLIDSDRSTKHNKTTVEFSDEQDRHETGSKAESNYTRAGDRVTASSSRSRGKHSTTLNDGQDIEMTPTVDKPATTRQEESEGNGGRNDRRGSREDRERNDGQEPKRNSSADDSGTTSVEGCSGESSPVLFLSLDIIKNDSRACSVDVGDKDYDTMKNLYRSYKDLRSSNFWNYKRPTGVKFYRFRSFISKEKRRYRVDIHRETEEYPPETDKTYEWKLEDEDGKMYPNGETWHFLNNPEDCGTSAVLKEMLPKKIKDENKSRMTMYGIYIEQQHSVWQIFIPVLLVLGLTLGGTLWFIFPWLKDHPGDLQNATVPVMLALAVVQFILTFLTSLIIFRWSL
ncbi:unnamed protein product [Alternaria alternata]